MAPQFFSTSAAAHQHGPVVCCGLAAESGQQVYAHPSGPFSFTWLCGYCADEAESTYGVLLQVR